MNCPNRPEGESEWVCLCDHPLDGSFISSWLGDLDRFRLKPGQDRTELVKELEEEANWAFGMWRNSL
jgi:hypothetical protein